MRTLSLTVVVNRDDDRFVAQGLEVDVFSFGDTQKLWFEDAPLLDHLSRPMVTTVDLNLSA